MRRALITMSVKYDPVRAVFAELEGAGLDHAGQLLFALWIDNFCVYLMMLLHRKMGGAAFHHSTHWQASLLGKMV
jgi:hypothetical protein